MEGTGRAHRNARAMVATTGLVILLGLLAVLGVALSFHGSVTSNSSANTSNSQPPLTSVVGEAQTKYWYVGASSTDQALSSNTGIRSMIQVESQNVTGVLSFWVSEALSNDLWAQVGYYIENGSTPVGFYEIWNLTDNSEVGAGICHIDVGIHTFSITLGNGTEWNFGIDSQVIGKHDMHTSASSLVYPERAMSEEGYTSRPFAFSSVLFLSGMQVMKSGSWQNASGALSFGSSWGIIGHNQESGLSQDEFLVGSVPILENNSTLWG
jgi:hypothetical protein